MQKLHWRRSRRRGLPGRQLELFGDGQGVSPPNFAPNASNGWYAYNRQFIAPASGAGPVQQDPTHPYVTNDEFRVTGRQPTQQLADLRAPILQPGRGISCASATSLSLPASPLCSRTQVAGRLAFPDSFSDP